MNLVFKSHSASIVCMRQIFSTHTRQRIQSSHSKPPFLYNPKQKTNSYNSSKQNVTTAS